MPIMAPASAGSSSTLQKGKPESLGLKRLCTFVFIAIAGLAISYSTPMRDYMNVASIRALSLRLGYWGPILLLCAGAVAPQFFLPRWPICFLAGLLYGVVWGSILANVASAIGAWFHYLSAKVLVSASSQRLLKKCNLDPEKIPDNKVFLSVFLLRAFPLSNSAATNVLAGALKLSTSSYFTATFLGMIPSTVMYAAWGKLLKKPGSEFYWLAVISLTIVVGGTFFASQYLYPWIRERKNGGE